MNTKLPVRDYERLDAEEGQPRGLQARARRAIALGFGKSFWGFAALALVSGVACYLILGAEAFAGAIREDLATLSLTVPRIVVALGIAGLIWVLLPRDRLTRLVGKESGLRGIVIAVVAGMVTPGGPSSAFPLLAMLAGSGADRGALVAYITSFLVLGLQRILVWDVPFMGAEFSATRFAISLPLVILAGLVARRLPLELRLVGAPSMGRPSP
ncbi:MAG: permease [Propylenella sp.]